MGFTTKGVAMFRFIIVLLSMMLVSATQAESFSLPVSQSGEEVTVTIYSPTFAKEERLDSSSHVANPQKLEQTPLLIWFTEGYSERSSFRGLIQMLNDAGFDVWQVDLLESYFIERTPNNVRQLTGHGVAEVLAAAQKRGRQFVPISTGRMSLILLRGARFWQLAEKPQNGVGNLLQTVLFFPNLYDAAKKAGDAPEFFPIVSATSLPITLVQPSEGTYRWKVPELQNALQTQGSRVTTAAIPKMRDWYFLRRQLQEPERIARDAIPHQLLQWLQLSSTMKKAVYHPVAELEAFSVTERVKGLVEISTREAPKFELVDASGKSLDIADKKGKVVLLNFWASWCPPCVKEIPSMNRLAESFDDSQFEIVSVNFKESPKVIDAFMKQVKVDFPVLMDLDGKVSAKYEIFSFPSSFLIDAKGQLRYSVNAAIEWDEEGIKQVIHELIPNP